MCANCKAFAGQPLLPLCSDMPPVDRLLSCLISAATLLCGCSAAPITPSPLERIDRVEVRYEYAEDSLLLVTDSTRVKAIVDFVNARRDGWKRPFEGVPGPRVLLIFYVASVPQGAFGAGADYFFSELHGMDGAAVRPAESPELDEFAALTGVARSVVNRSDRD